MFIVCRSVLSSQPINGETSILSMESIPHDLAHVQCLSGNNVCVAIVRRVDGGNS